ncbi:helix-turn-helix domain-containing protein [Enterococcus sp. PF-2]|uniref:helix-turn-helix domain-containing protein n=1 Tax=Enterococcus TaxID=1350 RepID=UPI000FF8B403|nr:MULTISPECIES: helix-turn-helix domain-containing protein [Enterococcus]MDO7872676.1 helix-turn-helix domain-containing protein [Enterococcus casseliflavus]MEB8400286.1 helix-turn-helix domain-containing protein [Enterococcus casseliflavus]RXA69069.1 helix-turn-helix domain-containing protein [Enterococcus casseliflavus]TPE00248.1 helix-turn-helix domain-containing protein [Enterococcus sp. PF-3]TPE23584.1 helix-turn-helix domain-containing protein [Enterococcus sp. PF-2]
MTGHRSYFAIIPANVRYDKKLTANAKLLYGEITALANEKGYCWAGDRYFAELYGVSKTTIQSWIKALTDNGYITKELIYREGTKEILNRYIRIVAYPTQENLGTPTQENLRDNNTSFNNTFNKTNKEEVETSSRKYSDEHFRLASKLQNNLIDDFPKEMKKADLDKWADVIRLMEEKDQHTIEQIDYVLSWLPSNSFWFGNIRSAKKLRDKFETLKFEIKTEKSKKQGNKNFVREEKLPDRFVNPETEPTLDPKRQAEIEAKLKAYQDQKKGAAT